MRILQVCPRYPPQTGGVETHVAELSQRLVTRGHDVTVHTADAGREVASREVRDGVDVRRHRAIAPNGAFHVAPGIVPAVRRTDADVVHAHNYHSLPLLLATLGASPDHLVATPHYHSGSANRLRRLLLRLYRPIGGIGIRRAEALIAVSDWERNRLRDAFGVDAEVIPNGVDIERFRNARAEQRDQPYLLVVGRLQEYKGVQHVIRTLPELPGYHLLVVGRGPYGNRLRQLASSAGVEDRVEFLGFVEPDRLPGLYAGAEATLAISTFEAYGMTVAESLAAGTPCVVYRSRGLADWCDWEAVTCVDTRDPATLATAVNATVGRSVSTSIPTWDETCDRVEACYQRLHSTG